jgi:hypothetical protein
LSRSPILAILCCTASVPSLFSWVPEPLVSLCRQRVQTNITHCCVILAWTSRRRLLCRIAGLHLLSFFPMSRPPSAMYPASRTHQCAEPMMMP